MRVNKPVKTTAVSSGLRTLKLLNMSAVLPKPVFNDECRAATCGLGAAPAVMNHAET